MQKIIKCMLCLLLFFMIAFVAEAEEKATAIRFTPWSDWQMESARQNAFQEVEKKPQSINESYDAYRYTRYKHFNTEKEEWYVAAWAPDSDPDRPKH